MGRGGNKDNLARLAALSTGGALGRLIRAVETFGFHFAMPQNSDVHPSQFRSGSGPSGNDRGQRADPSSSTWLRQQPAAPPLRVRTV